MKDAYLNSQALQRSMQSWSPQVGERKLFCHLRCSLWSVLVAPVFDFLLQVNSLLLVFFACFFAIWFVCLGLLCKRGPLSQRTTSQHPPLCKAMVTLCWSSAEVQVAPVQLSGSALGVLEMVSENSILTFWNKKVISSLEKWMGMNENEWRWINIHQHEHEWNMYHLDIRHNFGTFSKGMLFFFFAEVNPSGRGVETTSTSLQCGLGGNKHVWYFCELGKLDNFKRFLGRCGWCYIYIYLKFHKHKFPKLEILVDPDCSFVTVIIIHLILFLLCFVESSFSSHFITTSMFHWTHPELLMLIVVRDTLTLSSFSARDSIRFLNCIDDLHHGYNAKITNQEFSLPRTWIWRP